MSSIIYLQLCTTMYHIFQLFVDVANDNIQYNLGRC